MFLWGARLLLSKHGDGAQSPGSTHFHRHTGQGAGSLWTRPRTPPEAEADWLVHTHDRGCFPWLALLRLLSFSFFRLGWVITPSFQVSPHPTPVRTRGIWLREQTWAWPFASIWHFPSLRAVTWDNVKKDESKTFLLWLEVSHVCRCSNCSRKEVRRVWGLRVELKSQMAFRQLAAKGPEMLMPWEKKKKIEVKVQKTLRNWKSCSILFSTPGWMTFSWVSWNTNILSFKIKVTLLF